MTHVRISFSAEDWFVKEFIDTTSNPDEKNRSSRMRQLILLGFQSIEQGEDTLRAKNVFLLEKIEEQSKKIKELEMLVGKLGKNEDHKKALAERKEQENMVDSIIASGVMERFFGD